jgi:DMSO reductase anchor subunit
VVLVVTSRGRGPLLGVAAIGAIAQLLVYRALIERVASGGEREYRGTARLLFETFRAVFFARVGLALGTCAFLAIAALGTGTAPVAVALACALVGEMLGRYLFYVTVTPMSSAGSFFK